MNRITELEKEIQKAWEHTLLWLTADQIQELNEITIEYYDGKSIKDIIIRCNSIGHYVEHSLYNILTDDCEEHDFETSCLKFLHFPNYTLFVKQKLNDSILLYYFHVSNSKDYYLNYCFEPSIFKSRENLNYNYEKFKEVVKPIFEIFNDFGGDALYLHPECTEVENGIGSDIVFVLKNE